MAAPRQRGKKARAKGAAGRPQRANTTGTPGAFGKWRDHCLGPTSCTWRSAPIALVGTSTAVALDECSRALFDESEPGGEHDRPGHEADGHDGLGDGVDDAHAA